MCTVCVHLTLFSVVMILLGTICGWGSHAMFDECHATCGQECARYGWTLIMCGYDYARCGYFSRGLVMIKPGMVN